MTGETFVNGIRVTEHHYSVERGSVFVIENYLPLKIDTNKNADEISSTTISSVIISTKAPIVATTTEPTTVTSAASIIKRPSPFLVKKRRPSNRNPISGSDTKNLLGQEDITIRNTNDEAPAKTSIRTTRFDKFKDNKPPPSNFPQRTSGSKNQQRSLFVENSPTGTPLFSTFTTAAPRVTESTTVAEAQSEIGELNVDYNEFTTTEVSQKSSINSSTTPDIFAFVSNNSKTTTPASSDLAKETTEEVTTDTAIDLETETPFLAFDTFIKTTSNGNEFFADSGADNANETAENGPMALNIDDLDSGIEPEIEFLADSDFVPFNEFLNSQTATEKFSEAFEMLPEGGEVGSSLNTTSVNNSTNFLTWLKSEVKSRQQLGGKEFLHHLLESGVYRELTSGMNQAIKFNS